MEENSRSRIPRAYQVEKLLREGASFEEAAEWFDISVLTVKHYNQLLKGIDISNPPKISRGRTPAEKKMGYFGLSPGQKRVVDLVRDGLFNKEIADKLCISEKTVKFHLTDAFKILKVRSRMEVISRFPPGQIIEKPEVAPEEIPQLPVGGREPEVATEISKTKKLKDLVFQMFEVIRSMDGE